MGTGFSTGFYQWKYPDEYPQTDTKTKFDPNYGFSEPREPKGNKQ